MAKQDYYEILEVTQEATPDEIKRSYRKLAFKCHPDRNKGDSGAEQKFKLAAEAYEVLSSEKKRRIYDQFGHAGLEGAGAGPRGFSGVDEIFAAFSDIFGSGSPFEDFFGFGGARRGRSRGEIGSSLKCELELTLEEVFTGVEKTIELRRGETCDSCEGSGAAKGTVASTCGDCGGAGQVQMSQGFFAIRQTCPKCRGEGAVITTPCDDCRGSGRVPKKREITVRVPAGVPDGTQLRVSGEGEPGRHGGRRGDLYCFVRITKHPILERDDDDLVCNMPISFTQATLGSEVEVPTLTEKHKLKIPRGTQSGKVFCLQRLGLPNVYGHGHGDLLVRVQIETPKNLSQQQEELLREFAKTEDLKVSPQRKSWLDKVRELFD